MSNLCKFFSITPPEGESPVAFAKRTWDTYGFDYDLTRAKSGDTVLAWALDEHKGAEVKLARTLEEDGIAFTTFDADPDQMFT